MSLLKWKRKYTVGVTALDHHRKLFVEILNELHAASMKGEAVRVTEALLIKLRNYALNHHSNEERLLEESRYPGVFQQRERHRKFADKLAEFESRHKQGDYTVYVDFLCFLRDWLDEHMLIEDGHYCPFLNRERIA